MLGVPTDIEGTPRGTPPDIGAYENTQSSAVEVTTWGVVKAMYR